jgi:hypothetical protein
MNAALRGRRRHVETEDERRAYEFARYDNAEWYAAVDRSEDPTHYWEAYKLSEHLQGFGCSLDEFYAAEVARLLNKMFGGRAVGYFRTPFGSEWRPEDTAPGMGLPSGLWKRKDLWARYGFGEQQARRREITRERLRHCS